MEFEVASFKKDFKNNVVDVFLELREWSPSLIGKNILRWLEAQKKIQTRTQLYGWIKRGISIMKNIYTQLDDTITIQCYNF